MEQILEKRLREAGFIFLTLAAIFLLISLLTYNAADPGWSHTGENLTIANSAGAFGAWLADFTLYFFGLLSYLLPLLVAALAIELWLQRVILVDPPLLLLKTIGISLTVLGGCGLASLHLHYFSHLLPTSAGGVCGLLLTNQLIPMLSELGTTLICLAAFLTGITIATGLSWLLLAEWLGLGIIISAKYSCLAASVVGNKFFQLQSKIIKRLRHAIAGIVTTAINNIGINNFNKKVKFSINNVNLNNNSLNKFNKPIIQTNSKNNYNSPPAIANFASGTKIINKITQKNLQPTTQQAAPQILPPIDLLEPAQPSLVNAFSPETLANMAREVEQKLLDFGITVKVVGVYPGPVITRLEMELAPGIKASRISALAKDLARSLLVSSVRVVEVIPGKSVVGLEIPNEEREVVQFRDLVESRSYQQASSPITLALGKDISGLPVVVNLAKMPHLLIAGTTGSGKSVGINALLLSILYKATPDQVKLILIDPKMLELSVYEGIPHLLAPVVTDMKDAANALKWCVTEMERRYQLMAAVGVRNLAGFNDKIAVQTAQKKPLVDPLWDGVASEAPTLAKLPYVVIIIDEFADMIMVVGKKVEELIARIAQKARAAGIHMILATQRPSVDVITGLIKANVPTRISFQVSSKIDSRTILDQQGAEQLLGAGDMLYLPPGTGIPTRVHGAYVSDQEVHAVVKKWHEIGPAPEYIDDISSNNNINLSMLNFADDEIDELYDEAVLIVTESKRASISNLQRRLKIGYNRAARLVEQMEAAGVVSELQANGMREVLAQAPPDLS